MSNKQSRHQSVITRQSEEPLLISRIARVCVNGVVSGGHDIEYIYNNQVKKYKLDDREQAEVRQLIEVIRFKADNYVQ